MTEFLDGFAASLGGALPIGLAGVAAFVSVLALCQAFRLRNPVVQRSRTIVDREEELRTNITSARKRKPEWADSQSQAFMSDVVARLKLMKGQKAQELRDHLAQGGFRSREALIAYLFFKLVLPLAFGIAAILALEVFNLYPMPALGRIAVALVVVLIGAFSPEIWLKNEIAKRRKALEKGLPDALDLLVICVEAGLSLDAGLKRTAEEMKHSTPELADEFSLTSVELGFLPDRSVAFRNLSSRAGIKSLSGVVSAL
ncbi:MAG: type II secretion system F family protein, partial [Rhodospirillales bacterium]|nr:type II secretion system F family protein [Rhodospirillales bacterium]